LPIELEDDVERRKLLQDAEQLRQQRNLLTREIAEQKSRGIFIKKKIEEAKKLPARITAIEKNLEKLNKKCDTILYKLPNILHDSVPVGEGEEDNKLVRDWGRPRKFSFEPKDHIDVALALDLLDMERAAKISGSRFFFMKNELAQLDLALMTFATDFLIKKGFSLAIPPYLMRRKPYEGVVDLADFEDVLYKIEKEDLYLIATSEHPLTAQHMDEVLLESYLPLRYCGISTNFRKEAGAHGKDTKGIFRVHQFSKIEQIVLCKPEDSWDWHEQLISNAEEFFQLLGIPYRVMNICTGDIGSIAAKKYDLELWLPAQQRYREVVSCANCTDYQARRLSIRYREKEGMPPKGAVHTLNSTLVTDRALVAILENFQQSDGSIEVPEALHKYCGFKKIEKKQ
jgi:seryl-tRNA synthetase